MSPNSLAGLDGYVAGLLLLAAVLHASWNALVKMSSDRLLTQALVIGTGSVVAALAVPFVAVPLPAAWPCVALSVVAHTGYYAFLVQGYEHGDLSQVYPLARGVAPLLVALMAALLVGETLGPVQSAGVVLVSLGIASLAFFGNGRGPRATRPVIFALITGLFITFYTLVDGIGVRLAGSAAGYVTWIFLLDGIPLVLFVLWRRRGRVGAFLSNEWRPGVFGGLIAATGYAIVVWAMGRSGLAHVASLRETSVLIAALIGTRILGEASLGTRVAAAACVAAGNALLLVF